MATPCQERPWVCKPRRVKIVAFDADDTIWDIKPYGIASSITGPLKRIDDDTVEAEEEPYSYGITAKKKPKKGGPSTFHYPSSKEPFVPIRYRSPGWWKSEQTFLNEEIPPEEDAELEAIAEELIKSLPEEEQGFYKVAQEVTGEPLTLIPIEKKEKKPAPKYEPRRLTIKLKPGFRNTLDELLKKDIKCSIISLNTENSVKRILAAFGLKEKFVQIDDTWGNKGTVFSNQMVKLKINPCDAIFVDNMQSHVEDVSKHGALGLVFGHDVKEIAQVLSYIENNHGN